MKAKELQEYLRSLDGGWVDGDQTVDGFKAGDPETEIKGIAVGWMSFTWALKEAIELGANVFVTHEPTFYHHRDADDAVFRFEAARQKKALIEQAGLVVIRCHDLWDQYPGIGIPDAWARFLGLDRPVASGPTSGYYRVFDVSGRTARHVAEAVAHRVAALGQSAVQLIGPGDKKVTRAAIGTGAIAPMIYFAEQLGADLPICTDDGFCYWRDAALAIDMDLPVIVVNHPVAEEHGLACLAEHLRQRFAPLPVHHILQQCMYELIGG